MRRIQTRLLSPLEKVFPSGELSAPVHDGATALRGEVHSFQLALRCASFADEVPPVVMEGTIVRVDAAVEPAASAEPVASIAVELREAACVPVEVPCIRRVPGLLTEEPGLFPDPLTPMPDRCVRLECGRWRSVWVTVRVPGDCPPGKYRIKLAGVDVGPLREDDEPVFTEVFELEVLAAALAPTRLLRYEWLHVDCLADYYRVPVWSEAHWRIVENFVRNGAAHGLNVLLTPLWTPPLDTAVGGERTTAQLLDVEWSEADGYRFDFTRLGRFIDMGQRAGITHFAMSHAFTQWGARATPKIVVRVVRAAGDDGGKDEKRFGWHVASDDPAYAEFLRALMAGLLPFLRARGLGEKVFFSVSDEPSENNLDSYAKASALLASVIDGMPTLEALSSFEFYQRGLVKRPVPANDHIEAFVGNVPELWTYYCIAQDRGVPNRFMAQPSACVRIIGVLAYVYKLTGFLQWAFNFYNTQFSLAAVDPWRDTCAGRWTPGGDAFIVYPGADGEAVDSLRHEVFHDGLQDLRALEALEARVGREAVLALIHDGLSYKLRMDRYPRSADWLLSLRERANRKLVD